MVSHKASPSDAISITSKTVLRNVQRCLMACSLGIVTPMALYVPKSGVNVQISFKLGLVSIVQQGSERSKIMGHAKHGTCQIINLS